MANLETLHFGVYQPPTVNAVQITERNLPSATLLFFDRGYSIELRRTDAGGQLVAKKDGTKTLTINVGDWLIESKDGWLVRPNAYFTATHTRREDLEAK